MSTAGYCLKQGFKNFIGNPLFSLASAATVGACIFLFGMFLILAVNLNAAVIKAETKVGITVFFSEGLDESGKERIRNRILAEPGVKEVRYISPEEAWEGFQETYFGNDKELTEAFDGENPLAGSDSFEVFMEDVDQQPGMAAMLSELEGIRDVRFASSAVSLMKKLNNGIYGLSAVIIGILFAVSVFLISNTIRVTAVFRRRENEIMKLIGAKDSMISAPFVIEGCMIGLLGMVIPLTGLRLIYSKLTDWFSEQVASFAGSSVLKDVFAMIPYTELRPALLLSGLILGFGMGTLVSIFTVNSHLRSMK